MYKLVLKISLLYLSLLATLLTTACSVSEKTNENAEPNLHAPSDLILTYDKPVDAWMHILLFKLMGILGLR